jgi:YegS/Rv2252/BmrU family lipid kinase
MPPSTTDDCVVICNPESGTGDHLSTVRQQAANHGYTVRETNWAGHAVDLAGEAVEAGATVIAAAGGDGTLNEVVRGIEATGALDRVTVGVIPCGTGNNFAKNIGITGIAQAFETVEAGDCREVDLAFADGRPFVNSCVGGLTAEASASTSPDLKRRFGSTAYVLSTLRTVRTFDSLRVTVEMYDDPGSAPVWTGDAVAVLVGNGRRFPPGGSQQANMEDGRFDVTLVRNSGSVGLLRTAAAERLFKHQTPWTSRYTVSAVDITVADDEPVAFSLDGEIIRRTQLSLRIQPKALRIAVGENYEPAPE